MDEANLEIVHYMKKPAGVFAGDLLKRSRQYFKAFQRLMVGNDEDIRHPGYFLLTHAVELALKARLISAGVPRARLKTMPLRHDLVALLEIMEHDAACEVPEPVFQLVHNLRDMNHNHDFRYPTGYRLTVPYPDWCINAMGELLRYVEPAVDQAAAKATVVLASETRHLRGKAKIVFED
jgi:HEPN domain-containing protein